MLAQEISRENQRVKSANMARCKRMQGEYKMYLVQMQQEKQHRKEELETTRER